MTDLLITNIGQIVSGDIAAPLLAGDTVVVRLGNGSLSPQWRGSVKPDEARKLTYDVATQRWNDR